MSPTPEVAPYNGPAVYPQAILLSTLATVATLLSVPPLILNIKSRNLAITTLILSMLLTNLQNAINPLIWPNDDSENWYGGHILCDIEAKLQVGLAVSIPSSAACISRHLASIFATTHRASIVPSPRTRRARLVFDITLCVVLPVYLMTVHILVQPYRYYIYGITGCQYSLSRSWATVALVLIWPVGTSVLNGAYGVVTIARLLRHRRQVSALLATADVSTARFARVFLLSAVVVAVYAPLAIYIYVRSLDGGLRSWSWPAVHPRWWAATVVRQPSGGVVWFDRWAQVVGGFLVFAVFGLGRDAFVIYHRWAAVLGFSRLCQWLRPSARNVVDVRTATPGDLQRARGPVVSNRIGELGVILDDVSVDVCLDTRDTAKEVETGVGFKSLGSVSL